MKSVLVSLLFAFFLSVAFGEEEASPKDRLIVETLTRLKRFDVTGNDKWKGAVERYARSLRGKEGYFELVDQFTVETEASALIQFVQKNPSAEDAAKALQLLFRLDKQDSIASALSVGPKEKSDAIAKLVGFIQTPEAKKLLERYRTTNKQPQP